MVKEEKTVNYSLDALISINEKGQMVIPREIRKKADIKTGDKLVIITFEKEEKIVCIVLIKAEEFKER